MAGILSPPLLFLWNGIGDYQFRCRRLIVRSVITAGETEPITISIVVIREFKVDFELREIVPVDEIEIACAHVALRPLIIA